jgi:hypothetical protein
MVTMPVRRKMKKSRKKQTQERKRGRNKRTQQQAKDDNKDSAEEEWRSGDRRHHGDDAHELEDVGVDGVGYDAVDARQHRGDHRHVHGIPVNVLAHLQPIPCHTHPGHRVSGGMP